MPFSNLVSSRLRRVIALWCALVSTVCLAGGPAGAAGKVVSVIGTAFIRDKPARPGDGVFPGDDVRTGEKSGVKLLMADRSVIDIGANSSFKITEFKTDRDGSRNVDTSLDFGNLRAAVTKKLDKKSKFFIRTKSSVLAVRGTELFTRWERIGSEVNHQLVVSEGNVLFTPAGGLPPVSVDQGTQYTSVGMMHNETFRPGGGTTGYSGLVRLTPTQLNEVVTAGRIVDPTFSQQIVVRSSGDGPGSHGAETMSTVASAVQTHNAGDRRPASIVSMRDVPAATGDDVDGGNFLPGYSLTGHHVKPVGIAAIPQVPVNITVVLDSAP